MERSGVEKSADAAATKIPDRVKLSGIKRSQLTDGYGIPLVTHPAPANTRDHTLLPATLDRFTGLEAALGPLPERPRLDARYDYSMVHLDLQDRGITGRIAERGAKTPIRTGGRWSWSAPTPG